MKEWLKFYDDNRDVFSGHQDSGVGQLLTRLNEGSFPLLPDCLEYDDGMEYYKYFTLCWTGRFFIQIPFYGDTASVTLTSTSGGPSVKFNTVIQMAEHLIDNIFFYQK